MGTNQEEIIAAAETLTSGSDYDYVKAIYEMALSENPSITNTNINGALIEYLQAKLGSANTNINGLLAEYSAINFDGNVNSINDLTLSITPQLPDLKLWLDASDVSTIIHVSGNVSQWSDKSGEGNHLVQSTGSLQPITNATTQNGNNVIDFNADRLQITDFVGGALSQPNTIFVVYKYDDLTDSARIFDGGQGGSERHTFTHLNVDPLSFDNSLELQAGVILRTIDLGLMTSFQLVRCVTNGSSSGIFKNGVSVISADAGSNPLDGFTVGATYQGSAPIDSGSIAEVLVYNRLLDGNEVTTIETYLNTKWGI